MFVRALFLPQHSLCFICPSFHSHNNVEQKEGQVAFLQKCGPVVKLSCSSLILGSDNAMFYCTHHSFCPLLLHLSSPFLYHPSLCSPPLHLLGPACFTPTEITVVSGLGSNPSSASYELGGFTSLGLCPFIVRCREGENRMLGANERWLQSGNPYVHDWVLVVIMQKALCSPWGNFKH